MLNPPPAMPTLRFAEEMKHRRHSEGGVVGVVGVFQESGFSVKDFTCQCEKVGRREIEY